MGKSRKLILTVMEFNKQVGVTDYNINGIDNVKAQYFVRYPQGQFEDLAKGDYEVIQDSNNQVLRIKNMELLDKAERFQIGYLFDFSSSKYEVDFGADVNILKDRYNELVEDVEEMFKYVKNNMMGADGEEVDTILPQLDTDEVWVKTDTGYRGFKIGDIEANISEFWKQFAEAGKKIIAQITQKGDEQIEVLENFTQEKIKEINEEGLKLKITQSQHGFLFTPVQFDRTLSQYKVASKENPADGMAIKIDADNFYFVSNGIIEIPSEARDNGGVEYNVDEYYFLDDNGCTPIKPKDIFQALFCVVNKKGAKSALIEIGDPINLMPTVLNDELESLGLATTNQVVLSEPTIEKLRLSTKYKIGDIVEVLGYYQKGDGAGHKRIINQANDGSGIELSNGLFANIVHNGEVNVSWFGAKGDGVHDDTELIQKAINIADIVNFENKTYMINSVKNGTLQEKKLHGLKTKDNLILNFNGGTLKSLPNNSDRYTVLRVESKNVKLSNPIIIGDRDSHITTPSTNPNNVDGFTGEWGYGIQFVNCENVYVVNPNVTKCWGDSYIIDNAKNLVLENPYGAYSRRQGISLISGENIKILNPTMENISGTKPQAGIVIEPDSPNEKLKNIYIDNLVSNDCVGDGLALALINQNSTTPKYDIEVTSVTTKNCNGVQILVGKDSENVFKFGKIDTQRLVINSVGQKTTVFIDSAVVNYPLKISSSKAEGVLTNPTTIFINNLTFYSKVDLVIEDYTVSGTSFTNKIPNIFIKNVFGNSESARLSYSRTLPITIENVYTYDSSTTSGAYIELRAFTGNYIDINKPINLELTITKNCTLTGTKTTISNKSDKNITFKANADTFVNGVKTDLIVYGKSKVEVNTQDGVNYTINKLYETAPITMQLDTPHYAEKMKSRGIYNDYITYRDEIHAYENSKNANSNGIMTLMIIEEPTMPKSVEEFAKEYNLI